MRIDNHAREALAFSGALELPGGVAAAVLGRGAAALPFAIAVARGAAWARAGATSAPSPRS